MGTLITSQFLPVVDGQIKLRAETLPSEVWQRWLHLYHADKPLVLQEAQRDEDANGIQVRGRVLLLGNQMLMNVSGLFQFRADGQVEYTLRFVCDQRPGYQVWDFAQTLPALRFALPIPLPLENLTFVLTSKPVVDDATQVSLPAGFHLLAKCRPAGVLGPLGAALPPETTLDIAGNIIVPESAEPLPPLPPETLPWEVAQPVPGAHLQARLQTRLGLQDLALSDPVLHVYCPDKVWQKVNPSYKPCAAVTGNVEVAGMPFAASAVSPGFTVRAALAKGVTLPLRTLLKQYLPELPTVPDLTITTANLTATPGKEYTLTATMAGTPAWSVGFGPITAAVTQVRLEVVHPAGGKTTAKLLGRLKLANDLELEISNPLTGLFELSTLIPRIKLSRLFQLFDGFRLPLPPGFDLELINVPLIAMGLPDGLSLYAAVRIEGLGVLIITVQKQQQWGVAVCLAEANFEKLVTVLGLQALTALTPVIGLQKATLVLSSLERLPLSALHLERFGIVLPALPTAELVKGLTIYASVGAVTDPALRTLTNLLQVDLTKVPVTLGVSLPDPAKSTQLTAAVQCELRRGMPVTGIVGIRLQNGAPAFSFQGKLNMKLQGKPFTFDVVATVTKGGVLLSGTALGSITFPPFTLTNLAVVVGSNPAGLPSVGVAATVDIKEITSAVAIFADSTDPSKSMFAGYVSGLSLKQVTELFAGQACPVALASVLDTVALGALRAFILPGENRPDLDTRNVAGLRTAFRKFGEELPDDDAEILFRPVARGIWSLTDLRHTRTYWLGASRQGVKVQLPPQVYFAPQNTQIGTLQFAQGCHLDGKLSGLMLNAAARVNVEPGTGIAVDVAVDPIRLGNLLAITGADGRGGPQVSLDTNPKRPHFFISGRLAVVGMELTDARLQVTEQGAVAFHIDQNVSSLIRANLDGQVNLRDRWLTFAGEVSVGLDLTIDTWFGKVKVGVTVRGRLAADSRTGMTFRGGFRVFGHSVDLPEIHMPIGPLTKLPELLYGAVKDAVGGFLAKPSLSALVPDPAELAAMLADGGVAAEAVGKALDGLGVARAKLVTVVADVYKSPAEAVKALGAIGITNAIDVAKAFKEAGLSADTAAWALKQTGSGAKEIAGALKDAYGASSDAIERILQDTCHFSHDVAKGALKAVGLIGDVVGILDPRKWL